MPSSASSAPFTLTRPARLSPFREDLDGHPLWRAVSDRVAREEAGEVDGMALAVLQAGQVTPGLPLILWVHPGDACESDHPDEGVGERSYALQGGMGEELLAMGACDLVVLHRLSSRFAFEDSQRVETPYYEAMVQAMDGRVTHLYGDDLDAAAAWVLEHLAPHGRPDVLLTGAWSHPTHGCVAAVGQALETAGVAPLRVSQHSPSDPGSVAQVWQPAAPASSRPRMR